MAPAPEQPIDSVATAVSVFSKLAAVPKEVIIFRGHASFGWNMQPLLRRSAKEFQDRESDSVRELVAVTPDAFSNDESMFDRLVRAQHFGLPTRLLDMTSNPLVALYFAARDAPENHDGAVVVARIERSRQKYYDSDTVSCLSNLANLTQDERASIEATTARTIGKFNELDAVDRLVQFVRAEKPAFRPKIARADLFKRLHVIPKLSNPRIVAQSGSFILFGLPRPEGMRIPMKLERIRVIAKEKAGIRRDLESLGITESSLFPELDKAASHIVARLSRAS